MGCPVTLSTEEQIDAPAEFPEEILKAARKADAEFYSDPDLEDEIEQILLGRRDHWAEIQVACMAIQADRQRDQWQPIETAPQNGTRIILMWEPFGGVSEHVELGRWSERSGWVNTYGHAFTGYPTHWMPLPAAPKGGA